MKKTTLLIVLAFLTLIANAQIPDNFKYQAVIRDASGFVIANQDISMQISILEGSMTGSPVYVEDFTITTNSFGLVNLNIGSGNTSDDFSVINWATGTYFFKVEVDENAGSAYTEIGTSQLLSVPFSLYARNVENKDDADADPNNEFQTIQKTGNTVTLSNAGGSFTDEVNDGDYSATNELQTLNMNNDTLYLTNGGQIYFGSYTNQWQENGNNIYYNNGWVGIGTDTPSGKMVVQGDISVDPDSALFEVKNKDGQTIFAVYDGGVRIWVDDTGLKANTDKGGFAVGGYRTNKTISNEYLRITPDSARIYYDNENTGTGHEGGFQVEGFAGSTSQSNGGTMHLSDDNYFIGDSAGIDITPTGLYNSVFGYKAGKSLTEGDANVFLGYNAGMMNTTGINNVFIGNKAGLNNQAGFSNVFIGNNAGPNITGTPFPNGSANVYIGDSCGFNSLGGYTNVFVGYSAGKNNNTGYSNIMIGYQAGLENNDGNYNLFLGYQSGRDLVDGVGNTFLGNNAGVSATGGNDNIFIGPLSGRYQSSGNNNIYIGESAGTGESTSNTNRGNENIFIGTYAGRYNATGENNVFMGYHSGNNNTDGDRNVFIGYITGESNTIGNLNTFIGTDAGKANTIGNSNVYLGDRSGNSMIDGSNNTFLGKSTGGNQTTGGYNVFVGSQSAIYKTTGQQNVFMGYHSGARNQGDGSVIIGHMAGTSSLTGSKNILLGFNAGASAKGDNNLYINNDNSDSLNALVYGSFYEDKFMINHKTNSTTAGLFINNFNNTNVWSIYQYSTNALHLLYNGSNRGSFDVTTGAYSSVSDIRLKSNIEEMGSVLDKINQLQAKTYNFKSQENNDNKYIGFIAQDAIKLFPSLVYHTKGSQDEEDVYMIDYAGFSVVAIQAIKEQQKTIETLEQRIERLEKLILEK